MTTTKNLAILALITGCTPEYGFQHTCVAEGDLVVCPRPETHERAQTNCEDIGGSLQRQPEDRDEALFFGARVNDLVGGELAWVGWPDFYDCSVQGSRGATTPRPCEDLHPYACTFRPELR